MRRDTALTPDFDVSVTAKDVTPDSIEYARAKIGALGRLAHGPVLNARVRLSRFPDPAVQRPVVAQANLDVDGRLVRAQVQAENALAAIDLLEAKLRRRLERVTEHWNSARGTRIGHGLSEWRHGSAPTERPGYFPRPVDQRHVVRRKSFSMGPISVDEAIVDMELLDYDFHLFTEIGTGAVSVVYRGGPSGYRLALLAPGLIGELSSFDETVVISPHPAPCLDENSAVERLELLGLPFLFFVDAAEGRACVLYHRYDGHYGLITPAG